MSAIFLGPAGCGGGGAFFSSPTGLAPGRGGGGATGPPRKVPAGLPVCDRVGAGGPFFSPGLAPVERGPLRSRMGRCAGGRTGGGAAAAAGRSGAFGGAGGSGGCTG